MKEKETELLRQVTELVAQGLGRPTIAKTLGISEHKAMKLMREAKEPQAVPETTAQSPEGTMEQVKSLVQQGLTELQIAKELAITVNSAVYWCKRVRAGSTKYNKIDDVRGLLDKGYETYDIAKTYKSTPVTTARLIRKAEDDFDPLKSWVQRAAKTGIRYSELKKLLNLKTLDKAKEVITDNFPDCFIVETKLKDDVFLIPVYNSSKDIEWLSGPNKEKKFTYYVSPERNYMYVKVDDNLPEDTLEIYNCTDIHIGSKGHVPELYSDFRDIVESSPNALTLIGGDLGTFNHRTSVADPMEQYMRNTDQILEIVKSLKRVAHKALDWVGSNHDDDRTDRVAQVKPGEVMANMVAVPFFAGHVIIDIEWRGVRKTLLHAHNLGKAFDEAAILLEVKKMMSQYRFDINAVLLGHTHNGFRRRIETLDRDLGRGIVKGNIWVCNAGSTEGRTGTWIEKKGLAPTPQDVIYYSIREDGKDWATEIPVHNV